MSIKTELEYQIYNAGTIWAATDRPTKEDVAKELRTLTVKATASACRIYDPTKEYIVSTEYELESDNAFALSPVFEEAVDWIHEQLAISPVKICVIYSEIARRAER